MDFCGQCAFITGASVGIGRAAALLLAQRGAKIALCDINYEKLEKVKKEVENYTKDVVIYECDVTDEKKVKQIVCDASEKFGKIDILVNNAAIWRTWKNFLEVSSDEWKKFIDINIMGVVYFTGAVLPIMLENGYGRVINIGSVAGVYGNMNMVHYSATKGAVIAMTRALAKEVADKGVTVNCVSPGSVSDSSNDDIDYFSASELAFMGRTGTDRENAELICFLASKEAGYISGQNIQIDGCRKKQ